MNSQVLFLFVHSEPQPCLYFLSASHGEQFPSLSWKRTPSNSRQKGHGAHLLRLGTDYTARMRKQLNRSNRMYRVINVSGTQLHLSSPPRPAPALHRRGMNTLPGAETPETSESAPAGSTNPLTSSPRPPSSPGPAPRGRAVRCGGAPWRLRGSSPEGRVPSTPPSAVRTAAPGGGVGNVFPCKSPPELTAPLSPP